MSADEFKAKIGGVIANGFAAVGISMGTRLGLFEALARLSQSKETAVTTQQLADSLKYKERYVREWINGVALAGILSHEEIEGVDRYWLEPHCLPALLGDGMSCAARLSELLTAIANGQEIVEKCFPVDGPRGTDVDQYPILHEFLSKSREMWHSPGIIEKIFNDDILLARFEEGIDVVEIGCGAAVPTQRLAAHYPKSKFLASDISPANLERAKETCKGQENADIAVIDACNVSDDMTGRFDFAMLFDVYHDVPYPDQLIAGIKRMLRPGGMFMMNDINMHESVTANKEADSTTAAMYYTISSIYCMPTSYKYPGGAGLGACAGKELFQRKLQAEFSEVKLVAEDVGLFFLCTK